MNDLTRLLSILAIKRGHKSIGEATAVERYLAPYDPMLYTDLKTKDVLAYVIVTDPSSKTLFSCHVDTVHAPSDDPDSMQNLVVYDANLGIAYKDATDPTPLGADDGAGWWLMLEMIDAGVKGTYIFHRGEECGGIGSKGMADNYTPLLKTFDRAIAFDRRSTTSVITSQGWSGECASDEFATALAARLNQADDTFAFEPDPTGIYTDTAEYAHLIPECTNLSCGYDSEHSKNETLDVDFLVKLRDACLTIDWETLPVKRDHTITPSRYDWSTTYHLSSYSRGKSSKKKSSIPVDEFEVAAMTTKQAVAYCRKYPEDAAYMLLDLADKLMELYEKNEADTASEQFIDDEFLFNHDSAYYASHP